MLGNCRDPPPSVRRLAPHLLHILTLVWSVPVMPIRPPQVPRLVVLCLLPFALACVKAKTPGNGNGYGGGNPALNQAQSTLKLTLRELKWGFDPTSFATFTSCQNIGDPFLCNELENLNATQQKYLKAFLL